ncbi:MAG: glycosyl hydrolase [Acidimicrobiia bacterium]|nr:glycosyl hydrolase [Acidimicrobiia bacterium]
MTLQPPPIPPELLEGTSSAPAIPDPPRQRNLLAVGGPVFNIGLVLLLMAISFIAVALPEREVEVATDAGDLPIGLSFSSPVTSTTTTVAEREREDDSYAAQRLEELLDRLEKSEAALEAERAELENSRDDVEPTEPVAPEELVRIIYRTEQIPVPSPAATVPPRPECTDYDTRSAAQEAFDADPDGLSWFDGDGDGKACEHIPDPDAVQTVTCASFEQQPDAQAFFESDREALAYLDGDGDGRACEQLPGAPEIGPALPPAAEVLSVTAVRAQQGVFGFHTREAPWWMGELDYVSRLVGKAPNNLLFFSNWATPFPAAQVQTAWGRGMTPQVAWEPVVPGADSQPTLRQIIDGEWDSYIDEWASSAAAHGQPIVLRLAAEMNGNWYSWSEGVNGNQEGEFVEMWRHVHDRFDAAGADNVVWLWSVNRSDNLSTDIVNYWPGEGYTDWVGMSGYWRGYQGAAEPTFDAVFSHTMSEIRAITNKPILLAEIGTGTTVDEDRVRWMTSLFAGLDANPDIIGFVYFNDSKSGGDWRIQFSQTLVDALAEGVSDDRWKSGSLPTGMKIGDRLNVPAHSDPDNQDLAE